MKQILAVISLNQLETKMDNLQMYIIRFRFEQVLWTSPFTHANFYNFVALRHLRLFPSSHRHLGFNVEVLVVL